MSVYVRNLVINASADFSETLELTKSGDDTPVNLTGFGGMSHLRKTPESSTYVGFGVSFGSSADREMGKIVISMGRSDTSTLKSGRYVYDLLLIRPNSGKTIAVEGTVLVRGGISTECF